MIPGVRSTSLGAATPDGNVALVLVGREDLLQQISQLNLAPDAAGLDVGEHLLEVADAVGEVLYLTQTFLDGFQSLAHVLEGLTESLFERALELLVDGLAHLIELLGVVVLQLLQPFVDVASSQFLANSSRKLLSLRLPDFSSWSRRETRSWAGPRVRTNETIWSTMTMPSSAATASGQLLEHRSSPCGRLYRGHHRFLACRVRSHCKC